MTQKSAKSEPVEALPAGESPGRWQTAPGESDLGIISWRSDPPEAMPLQPPSALLGARLGPRIAVFIYVHAWIWGN